MGRKSERDKEKRETERLRHCLSNIETYSEREPGLTAIKTRGGMKEMLSVQ